MSRPTHGREDDHLAELLGAVRRHRLALFAGALLVLLAVILWSARAALPAFVIGLALAFVIDPGVTLLARRGLPRWLGVLAMYALVVALIWAAVAFAIPPIARQTDRFIDQLPTLGGALRDAQRAISDWYAGLSLPPELRQLIDDSVRSGEAALVEFLTALVAPTVSAILRAAAFVLGLIVIPIWLFFVLKDRDRLGDAVAIALPPGWRADAANVMLLLSRLGGRWVRGQLLLGTAIFVATAIGLLLLTLAGFREFGEFTLVLALIAGVLEWFPIIGPIVAAVPAILIGATISLPAAISVTLLYIAVQQLENNFLVPKVMGDAVELNPAVLILALVVGGTLFGLAGAVLAAPTVAAGRDLYRYGFLRLAGEPPELALAIARGHGRPAPIEPVVPADEFTGSRGSEARTVRAHPDRLADPEPDQETDQR